MRLVARQKICGIREGDDFGLHALDGIEVYEAEAESLYELALMFENEHPEWKSLDYEVEQIG